MVKINVDYKKQEVAEAAKPGQLRTDGRTLVLVINASDRSDESGNQYNAISLGGGYLTDVCETLYTESTTLERIARHYPRIVDAQLKVNPKW